MNLAPYQKTLGLGLLLFAAVSAAIAYWLTAVHPFESTDNAYLKAHITLISPKEMGYVKEVLFEDNQPARPGDLLVVLDDHDFRARLAQAEAQLGLETARIQTLETDKRTQGAKIRQEEANIASAEAEAERASKDLKRYARLVEEGAISAQSHDSAQSVQKQMNAQLERFRSARQEASSQMTALDAQIAESRARIKAAEAVLDLARIDLGNTRIVAPIAGFIGNRNVQVGQLVKPGSVLAHLIPEGEVFVEANFKETQIDLMRPGQPADIRVDAYPGEVFEGRVGSFSPASGSEFSLLPPENATGNFTKIVRRVPVKIQFKPGTDLSRLKPGLSTTVKVRVR